MTEEKFIEYQGNKLNRVFKEKKMMKYKYDGEWLTMVFDNGQIFKCKGPILGSLSLAITGDEFMIVNKKDVVKVGKLF